MNPSWPQLIISSLALHFTSYSDLEWNVYSEDEPKTKRRYWAELRSDGPWFKQLPGNWWETDVEVNILIMLLDPDNIYQMSKFAGEIVRLACGPIPIEELDGYCLKPVFDRGRTIQINNYGIVDKDNPIEQTTVEARYRVTLKGD